MANPKRVDPDGGTLYKRANDMFVKVTTADTGGAYEVLRRAVPARDLRPGRICTLRTTKHFSSSRAALNSSSATMNLTAKKGTCSISRQERRTK